MRKILVTGAAASGIGEAITRALIEENYHVIGLYASDDHDRANALREEYPGGGLELHETDLTTRAAVLKLTQKLMSESLSGIVNSQIFFEMENPERFDHNLWEKNIAVNLTAPNLLVRELQGSLSEGSSIVTITSTEAFVGSFGASAYAASKAAIHNLTKTFANLLGSRNIRANAVAAGWIGGVMDTDEIFNMSRSITPLGRLGRPEEIAQVVLFLLSDKSSFVNGSVIVADGGYSGVDTIAKYEFEAGKESSQ